MSHLDIRLLVVLVGLAGSFVSSLVSALVFLWLESRRRYLNTLTSLRVLCLLVDIIYVYVEANELSRAELKPEWLIAHADQILRDPGVFDLIQRLLRQVASIQRMCDSDSPDTYYSLKEIDEIRSDALFRLRKHQQAKSKLLLFANMSN